MSDSISYNETQRRILLSFVQWLADVEVTVWQRDGEDVVTMSRDDADKILDAFKRAQCYRDKYAGLPL